MTKHSDFARDFSAATRRALLKRGIAVIGICAIPDMSHPMPYANASRGYNLDIEGRLVAVVMPMRGCALPALPEAK